MHGDVDEISRLFAAVSAGRRRRVLGQLARHTSIALPDLADELAAAEHGTTLDEIPADGVTRLYLDLYHRHVPKLEAAALVRYDQTEDRVTITDRGRDVVSWLWETVGDDAFVADAF